jgi:hypothetical protein
LGSHSKEVIAILPLDLFLVYKAKVGLVDEGGGLQGVIRSFASQVKGSEPMKFIVDLRNQLDEGILIAIAIAPE